MSWLFWSRWEWAAWEWRHPWALAANVALIAVVFLIAARMNRR